MIFHTEDDFDLDKIADSGQCFRWETSVKESGDVPVYEESGADRAFDKPHGQSESDPRQDPETNNSPGKTGSRLPVYRILAGSRCLYISALGNGRFDLDCSDGEFEEFWRDYFDLGESYRSIRERIDPEKDPFLMNAAQYEKGIRILRQDPWETLLSFIISQNKNIPAIRRSIGLLCEACGDQRTDSLGKPYYAFPGPEAVASLSADDLNACRLGYRSAYVRAAAEAVLEGRLDLEELKCVGEDGDKERDKDKAGDKKKDEIKDKDKEKDKGKDNTERKKGKDSDEDRVIAALTGLYGVGIKVASCTALFGLHRLDAFPVDVWMKRILAAEYPDGYPREEHAPYNGVYQQYMFAYYRHMIDHARSHPCEISKKSRIVTHKTGFSK